MESYVIEWIGAVIVTMALVGLGAWAWHVCRQICARLWEPDSAGPDRVDGVTDGLRYRVPPGGSWLHAYRDVGGKALAH